MAKILTEASGSLVAPYVLKAIKDAGHFSVASDIREDCFANHFADAFVTMPSVSDPKLWQVIEKHITNLSIDMVLPSFDDTLLMWAERKDYFAKKGVHVIISPAETIQHFQDKWASYQFFCKHGLPCAKTSLLPEYPLIKPRTGSGAKGICIEHDPVMRVKLFEQNCLTQEVIEGVEYTVDCLFDSEGAPCYIIPRKRMNVSHGKSVDGVIEPIEAAISSVKELAEAVHFIGPVNIQLFIQADGSVKFVEVNPRIAGGMALSFAATENWIAHFETIITSGAVQTVPVKWGMKMFRAYQELYV